QQQQQQQEQPRRQRRRQQQHLAAGGLSRLAAYRKLGFHPRRVLDVGANEAKWTLASQEVFPGAEFLMLEADVRHSPKLEGVGAAFEFHLLGEQPSASVPFFSTTADLSSGASVHREFSQAYAARYFEELHVPMTTLDRLFPQEGAAFDLIKLDTQGSELAILRGWLAVAWIC
ncbi:unnamed protein product, partial [Polarella glacialis]